MFFFVCCSLLLRVGHFCCIHMGEDAMQRMKENWGGPIGVGAKTLDRDKVNFRGCETSLTLTPNFCPSTSTLKTTLIDTRHCLNDKDQSTTQKTPCSGMAWASHRRRTR